MSLLVYAEHVPVCGVAAYFNPRRYVLRKNNFDAFRESLLQQGLRLAVAELAFDDAPFDIEEGRDAELVVSIRLTRMQGDMWQKERLINVAIDAILTDDAWEHCKYIAWLDADTLLPESWVERAAKALETYHVVQPFHRLVRLSRQYKTSRAFLNGRKKLERGKGEGQSYEGIGYLARRELTRHRTLADARSHGYTGFAFVARRSVFDSPSSIRLYDFSVVGGGDVLIAHAMYGNFNGSGVSRAPYYYANRLDELPSFRNHYESWARRFYSIIGGSVGYLTGTAFHLWHGDRAKRQYRSRFRILIEEDYDPVKDVRITDAGALVWSSSKATLHRRVAEYFSSRDEGEQMGREPRRGKNCSSVLLYCISVDSI